MTKELDVSSEEYREYLYAAGQTFRIEKPEKLFILENGSHRVTAQDGLTYRPSPGWLAIRWKPKADQPSFVA